MILTCTYKLQMSSLEIQVTTLKRRVRQLQQQITQRTRNYLLQVQKFRSNRKRDSKQLKVVQKYEMTNVADEIVIEMRKQIDICKAENKTLKVQMLEIKDQLQSFKTFNRINFDINDKLLENTETSRRQAFDIETNTQFSQEICSQKIKNLQFQIRKREDTIEKKNEQLRVVRAQLAKQAQMFAKQRDDLEQNIRASKMVNETLEQEIRIRISTVSLIKEENELLNHKYYTEFQQKRAMQQKFKLLEEELTQIKISFSESLQQTQSYLPQFSILKQQSLNPQSHFAQQSYQKDLLNQKTQHSVQTNTDPLDHPQKQAHYSLHTQNHVPSHINPYLHYHQYNDKSKQIIKKSQTVDSSKRLSIDQEFLRQNDLLNQQLIKKEEEHRKLFLKIDELTNQNNKLIGMVQSHRRDIEYEKQAQKILNDNLRQQKNVIESQKATIQRLQKQYQSVSHQLDIKIDETRQRERTISIQSSQKKQSSQDLSMSNHWEQTQSRFREHLREEDLDNGQRTPIAQIDNDDIDDLEFESSIGAVKQKQFNEDSSISITFYPPPKLSRKESSRQYKQICKYQKKISSKTYQVRQEPSEFSSMKSSRIFTSDDLKTNIKGILDNSIMLGRGIQSIDVILSIIKQIETYSSVNYSEMITSLEEKKQLQKSASNTGVIKQITELAKVKEEFQQRAQTIRQQHQQIIKRKKDKIKELKQKKEKLEWTNQQLSQRVEFLEDQMEKLNKKLFEFQKETIKKTALPDNSDQIQKLKEEKKLLSEKIKKYEESIAEYDSIKKKLFAQNEKQKSQLLHMKQRYKKQLETVKQTESRKENYISKIDEQSEQFISMLLKARLEEQKKNNVLVSELKEKDITLSQLVEQIQRLNGQVKYRENDLLQVMEQVKQIRAVHFQLNNNNYENNTVTKLMDHSEEIDYMKTELQQKQDKLLISEKQVSRKGSQIAQLLKQIDVEKQKALALQSNNRRMIDEISHLSSCIQALQQTIAVNQQSQSYQSEKVSNQFQQVLNALFKAQKKQKCKQAKLSSNIFRSANSLRTENEQTTQNVFKQHKQMKSFIKVLNSTIYQVYAELPQTSQHSYLFEAESKQQLLTQLKDIRKFADACNHLNQRMKKQVQKVESIYKLLVKGLLAKVNGADQSFLSEIIDQASLEQNDRMLLKSNMTEMLPTQKVIIEKDKDKRRTSLERSL